jgi:hypothetical protein
LPSYLNDSTLEAAQETFNAIVSNYMPADATQAADPTVRSRFVIGTSTVPCYINDNEAAVTISIFDSSGVEAYWTGGTPIWEFDVRLSGAVDVPVTVTVVTGSNGDANFVFGTDIVEAAGYAQTLTFQPGQTQGRVRLHPRQDLTSEWSETMRMIISAFTVGGTRNVSIGDGTAIGTLSDY